MCHIVCVLDGEKECCVSVMCVCVLDRAGSRVVSGRALAVV